MSGDLEDRVALVTGAGRGLGRATALGLARAGARVGLLARSTGELSAAVDEIRATGGTAIALVADISDLHQAVAAFDRLQEELGAPSVLVNNAGVVAPLGPTQGLALDAIATALAVNAAAPIALAVRSLPGMIASGWGRIVNVSSGVASAPASMPGMTMYTASKAALEAHTFNLAAELHGTGVTANVYLPGTVDTSMQTWIREQRPELIGAALHQHFDALHTDGRLISAEESARSLLDLLPTAATGETWTVDDRPE